MSGHSSHRRRNRHYSNPNPDKRRGDMTGKSHLEILAQDVGYLLGALERASGTMIDAMRDISLSAKRLKYDVDKALEKGIGKRKKSVYDVDGHVVD